jgi:predicted DNA binding protein
VSVIVEFTVPAEDFALGQAFRETGGTRFELERLIPTSGAIIPFFWIHDGDYEAIAGSLANDADVGDVRVVDELDDRALFRIGWEAGIDGLIRSLLDLDVAILEAEGTTERWAFEFRFPSSESLSEFRTACTEAGMDIDVERVYDLTQAGTESDETTLTPAQREVMVAALDGGYFAIPRETNLVEIADDLGISDQAAGERMRRATAKLARASVVSDSESNTG